MEGWGLRSDVWDDVRMVDDSGVAHRLAADCARCAGLCCVAPAFTKSSDFAITKPAGRACPNLRADFRCGTHSTLREKGFPGCTVFDCFGAGQRVVQVTFEGRDWRTDPSIATSMFDAFMVMRNLHELLWYLTEALSLPAAEPIRDALHAAHDETERLAAGTLDALAALDVDRHRGAVNPLLLKAGELARAGIGAARDHRGANLIGAKLRRADLSGANLRGALLLGADLRDANLRRADVIGADFRGADLRGADLRDAIFLIQSQLDAAVGDRRTKLPSSLRRPSHWNV
jgi:uncharacterized protein YjbI with pentapeptide repeats